MISLPHHPENQPNLLRSHFPYHQFPRVVLEKDSVPQEIPATLWLTDTTFRDGQQAGPPYTPEQILGVYDRLHAIDGGAGLIRQCEFFLYSEADRRAVELCKERGYRFPEILGWMRARPSDLAYVTQAGIQEVGILASVSDYHIFLKLQQNRSQALRCYLDVIRMVLDRGLCPQCHLEDVTRADIDGFVLPFVTELLALGEDAGVPIKIRLCDTLGLGVPFPQAALPRSVPRLIQALRKLGVPAEQLEWHGHNDYHKAAVNAAAAWLYGCAAVNCTLCGVGERTGNPPLEALLIEHAQLKGMDPRVNYSALAALADYARSELGFAIPPHYPLVGEDVNVTRAGIHADGLLKHDEIYNGCDTGRLLQRPPQVTITNRSGLAGIRHWIKTHCQRNIPASDPRLKIVKQRIDAHYTANCSDGISNDNMQTWVQDAFGEEL